MVYGYLRVSTENQRDNKKIFRDYLDGVSINQIATERNRRGRKYYVYRWVQNGLRTSGSLGR
jgi:hypothetical protein